jgi:trimethylamine--corrinoid protein Co-methyltransferase
MPALMHASPFFQLFGPPESKVIHQASLEILRRTGARVHHPEALRLLGESGAVIREQNLVRFPPALVEWALEQAPAQVTLCRRGSSRPAILMDGKADARQAQVSFGTGSDCPNILDPLSGENRLATRQDVIDAIRLVDALPGIDFCMSMGVPSDLESLKVFQHQAALIMQYTSKPLVFISGGRADCEAIVAMAAAIAGGQDALRQNPTLVSYSQVTTPLVHNFESTDKLLYLAETALPVVHQPAPMMGGAAPVTMAGALALGNAEVLSSLVIHQLKRRGAPFIYGQGVHHMDMKTTISVYSAPEFDLARAAVADLARFYGLPNFGYAGPSDSCTLDEQAISDATSSILVALLSGQHLVHDIGYLESGLTLSPEMIVYGDDLIERMRHFSQGIALDAEALALEVIDQVGPGGSYLTIDHTLKHFRSLWQPRLINRFRRHDWIKRGALPLRQRLREKTLALIQSSQPAPLSEALQAELAYILKTSQVSQN